jgi:hemolysin activation/secretion protein
VLLVSAGGSVRAQAPVTLPPDVRQQGEQQERLQREREEAQRGLLQPVPQAPPPPAAEAPEPWPELESPCLPIHEIVLVGDSSFAVQWLLEELISGADPAIERCRG